MAIVIPGIDSDSGFKICGSRMDIYMLSLRLFASDALADLEKMKGVSEHTLKDYSFVVHEVKSMSQYVGAVKTSETAKHLEAMARNGDLAGVLALNDAFIRDTEIIVDNVKYWLKKNNEQGTVNS